MDVQTGNEVEGKRDGLFVDTSFPPDHSSLTYVYTGDIKYDKMIFVRPQDIHECPTITCRSPCELRLPWQHWMKTKWLQYAFAVISLNPVYLNQLLPDYMAGQGDGSAIYNSKHYTGKIRVQLWWFGRWESMTIDDFLPVFKHTRDLAYCPALGINSNEFWGPFLEKALAKWSHAYEVIETGDPLKALTMFTGAICEHFSLDKANDETFHILYKSYLNQSFLVAYRKDRSIQDRRHSRITVDTELDDSVTGDTLYVISSMTVLPLHGNEMRLVCVRYPFGLIPEHDDQDFKRCYVNTDVEFAKSLHSGMAGRERWMTVDTFCGCFSGVIVCSLPAYSDEPVGFLRYLSTDHMLVTSTENNKGNLAKEEQSEKGRHYMYSSKKDSTIGSDESVTSSSLSRSSRNTCCNSVNGDDRGVEFTRHSPVASHGSERSFNDVLLRMESMPPSSSSMRWKSEESVAGPCKKRDKIFPELNRRNSVCALMSSQDSTWLNEDRSHGRCFIASEVSADGLKLQNNARKSWNQLLTRHGSWTGATSGGDRNNYNSHSKNPRIFFYVRKVEQATSSGGLRWCRGKRHIVVSLMQDYRHGSQVPTVLNTIGFCVYKSKNPEKDEKRCLRKLRLIAQREGSVGAADVNSHLDLDPGYYFIVPYNVERACGEFLVRILQESDAVPKSSCVIS